MPDLEILLNSRSSQDESPPPQGSTVSQTAIQPPNIKRTRQKSSIDGHFDACHATVLWGWLWDPKAQERRLEVEIVCDGQSVGRLQADGFRSDLLEAGIGDGRHEFRGSVPEALLDGQEHVIEIREVSTGLVLQGSPKTFQATSGSRRGGQLPLINSGVAGILNKTGKVLGHFEHVEVAGLFCSGWAWVQGSDRPARVELVVNGCLAAEQTAQQVRPDLMAIGVIPPLKTGFKIWIPRAAITQIENTLEISVDGQKLTGSPKKLSFADSLSVVVEDVNNGEVRVRLAGWSGGSGPIAGKISVDGLPAGAVDLVAPPGWKNNRDQSPLAGRWPVPAFLQDAQPHVYVFEINSTFGHLRSDARVQKVPHYLGQIDHADFTVISGWIVRRDRPTGPIQLEVLDNGQRVGTYGREVLRSDIQKSMDWPVANVGFELSFEKTSSAAIKHYKIRDVETGVTVFNVSVYRPYRFLTEMAVDLAHEDSGSIRFDFREVLSRLIPRSNSKAAFTCQFLPVSRHTGCPRRVEVVIPVYGGCVETVECIESVLASENEIPSRIVIINDCTPDPLIRDYLASLEHRGRQDLLIIHRTVNGGFSQAVNIGMIVSGGHDVILLNADTLVQPGWIDRLAAVAARDTRIGTVTPLSNNAEICTVPYLCKSLPVHEPALAVEVDQIAATVNAGKTVDIPVAVGFCMYIRRECIDEVGLFDAARWGRGYGEEVDFCLKAAARGWRHVMTGDTFVVHRGAVSFGDEKLDLIRESAKKIGEIYPFYDQLIQDFLIDDPGAPIRRAVNLGLIGGVLPPQRILHITHGFGGGTEQYVEDAIQRHADAGYTPLVLRFISTGAAELSMNLTGTRLAESGFFAGRHSENYAHDEMEAMQEGIARLGFERLHIHAPFGIPIKLLDWLVGNYPFDMTIHDYVWICPRVTLTTAGGRYCGEPAVEQCKRCIELFRPHPGMKHFVDDAEGHIARYREVFGRIIAQAETVFAGTRDVVQRMERHGMQGRYSVMSHPAPEGSVFRQQVVIPRGERKEDIVRVALIGRISDTKGFHQLVDCAREAENSRLPIRFIVFGMTMDDSRLAPYGNVTILGPYREESLEGLMLAHRPHLAFFPNQWPETFSYTLSHAFRFGLWPVVPDMGAPAERVREANFGTVYPFDSQVVDVLTTLMASYFRSGVENQR